MRPVRYPLEDRYRPGMAFAIALGVAGLATIGIAIATGRFDDETDPTAAVGTTPANVANGESVPASGDAAAEQPAVHELVAVKEGAQVAVLDAPNGERLGTVADTTVFGNPSVLSVTDRRGPWLGVESELAGNDPVAWVESASSRLEPGTTPYSIEIDLLARKLELRRGTRVADEMPITVGPSADALPEGRFAISDRIEGGVSPALGAGALAMTAVAEVLPPDWPFGDRVAIHGGRAKGDPAAASVRVNDADMKILLARVPLGAPVYVVR